MRRGAVCDDLRRLPADVRSVRLNLLDRHLFVSVLATCAAAVGLFAFVVALPSVVK